MTTEYKLFDLKITQICVNRTEETWSAANMQVENHVVLNDEFVKIWKENWQEKGEFLVYLLKVRCWIQEVFGFFIFRV